MMRIFKNHHSFDWNPKLWRKEIRSMWRKWTPHRSSVIWKILGLSSILTWLNTSPKLDLILSEVSLQNYLLWTPLTSGWVLQQSSPLFTLLILGLIAAFKSGAFEGSVRRPRYFAYAAVIFICLTLFSLVLPNGLLWSVCSEGVTLIWFATELERRWGGRRLFILCALTLSIAYGLGAIYLYLFGGSPVYGIHPFTRGLILVWGHYMGAHKLTFLNVRGDQLRWVVYAFCGFELLLLPPPFGLVSLSATFFLDQFVRGKIPKI
jgi:hypothetical protein